MSFYKVIMVLTIFLIITLIHHVIHEYSHVLVAKSKGVKVTKVQWFTYSKFLLGTRVFFEKEPDLHEKNIEKKWGWISIAGFISTTTIGYIFTLIYLIYSKYMPNWSVLIICFFSIIFLSFDSLYFVIGGIFNFGDVIGFGKAFKISRSVCTMIFSIVLLMNILIVRIVWYSS